MKLDELSQAIKDLGAAYADSRINVHDVSIASVEDGVLRLHGRVLEASQMESVLAGLKEWFPEVSVDTAQVQVLRSSPPRVMSVTANLTSMHAGTSFISEMVTQLLNGMQVEILWEDGRWGYARKWNDPADSYQGWTYLPYLTEVLAPQPTHYVLNPVGLLRETPAPQSGLVTRVLGGTAVTVTTQQQGWACLSLPGGATGWLPAADLRALHSLPQGEAERRESMVADAFTLIGVPYLWGGCSANGIDCSGFAQLLHRWVGIALPRDADMQFAAGKAVEPPFQAGDLLFFGTQGEKRRITHVAVSLGGWNIIHSSRARNGVHVDDVQQVEGLRDSYLCAATYLRS